MKKLLLIGCGLVAMNVAASANTGVNVGVKLGGNFAASAKYKDTVANAAGTTIFTVTAGKENFSKSKTGGFGPSLEVFANKDFYNNGSMFINGELGVEIGGAKINIDNDLKNRLTVTGDREESIIKIKEKFSGNLCANIGTNASEDARVYAKLGVNLASINVKQTYDLDNEKNDIPVASTKQDITTPGLLLGAGMNYKISDSVSAVAEASYVFRAAKSLDDYTTKYGTNADNNSKFTNRKVTLNKAAVKVGVSFAI